MLKKIIGHRGIEPVITNPNHGIHWQTHKCNKLTSLADQYNIKWESVSYRHIELVFKNEEEKEIFLQILNQES